MTKQSDLQSLFDRSLAHIRQQGKPSVNADGSSCAYRFGELQCAAGPFITSYHEDMEGETWLGVCDRFPEQVEQLAFENRGIMRSMQTCHDSAVIETDDSEFEGFMPIYERNMRELAEVTGLEYKAA